MPSRDLNLGGLRTGPEPAHGSIYGPHHRSFPIPSRSREIRLPVRRQIRMKSGPALVVVVLSLTAALCGSAGSGDAAESSPGFGVDSRSGRRSASDQPDRRTHRPPPRLFLHVSSWAVSRTSPEWASYDPATRTARLAQLEGGSLTVLHRSERHGDTSDNRAFVLAGGSPADSIMIRPDISVDISESVWDDRPAWTILFRQPHREPICDGCDGCVDQVERQVVDRETGLIVATIRSVIGSPDETTSVEYSELDVVDTLPAGSPAASPIARSRSRVATPRPPEPSSTPSSRPLRPDRRAVKSHHVAE